MAVSRTVIIAGAGIGGLTAALALAEKQFRVVVLEQAPALEEIGAGLQLSANATRVLIALGLRERLLPKIVAPEALYVRSAASGRLIVSMPIGRDAEFRFGAPYWVLHRGDLHGALLAAAREHPDITIQTAQRATDFAVHAHGVTVQTEHGVTTGEERGLALVAADGLWSILRQRAGDDSKPQFRGRTAWRATLPASTVTEEFRAPRVNLWLGNNAHLVHYPVRNGTLINIVAIVADEWRGQDWSAAGERDEIIARFSRARWAQDARALIEMPQIWAKWALYDRPVAASLDHGPVTFLGDAAHPMLPFLGQGAAMAIEDAAVLANCLATQRDDPAAAMRRYEGLRRARTARVQQAARVTGTLYHPSRPAALFRNVIMRLAGGRRLRARYDWIYDWRPA